MNEKFYNLQQEKQDSIMNAAMRVFSKYDYRHASTDEIVRNAGISKGLLFHYFKSKKELYLTLYQYSIRYMSEHMVKHMNMEETDLFEILMQGQAAKVNVVKKHPYLFSFIAKAYYETEPEVEKELGKENFDVISRSSNAVLARADLSKFIREEDAGWVLKMVLWCSDGYMRESLAGKKPEEVDVEQMSQNFMKILERLRDYVYKPGMGHKEI